MYEQNPGRPSWRNFNSNKINKTDEINYWHFDTSISKEEAIIHLSNDDLLINGLNIDFSFFKNLNGDDIGSSEQHISKFIEQNESTFGMNELMKKGPPKQWKREPI